MLHPIKSRSSPSRQRGSYYEASIRVCIGWIERYLPVPLLRRCIAFFLFLFPGFLRWMAYHLRKQATIK